MTHEPGGTEAGKVIRALLFDKENNKDPRYALCLFLADRILHIQQIIEPAVKDGKIVICDRFQGSTFAYQSFAGNLDFQTVQTFNNFITGGLQPEVTILFDQLPEVGLSRKKNLGVESNHYDEQKLPFHQKLRNGYLQMAKIFPNWVVVDATNSPEKIHQEVINLLKDRRII